MERFIRNPAAGPIPEPLEWNRSPAALHRRLPGYEPTPLESLPELAESMGVGQILVKNESSRLGLPAFKMLGASWATYRAVVDKLGREPAWSSIDELRDDLDELRPMTLAAATDGNHGRAVARMANLLGFGANIFVPEGMVAARIAAIESEGATVEVVPGDYDDAVARSALEASESCLVVSDTSWPGYVETPRHVIEGYSTIFFEIDDELAARDAPAPTLALIPAGVGAFAAAAVSHYRRDGLSERTTLVSVEPNDADCVLASVEAGEIALVPGPHRSIMVGLNCGRPSLVAWPIISHGLDACLAIDDARAADAMRDLARVGIVAGETGAASLGGLTSLLTGADAPSRRAALGLDTESTVLLVCTEGATDPENYLAIVGRSPDSVSAGRTPPV